MSHIFFALKQVESIQKGKAVKQVMQPIVDLNAVH